MGGKPCLGLSWLQGREVLRLTAPLPTGQGIWAVVPPTPCPTPSPPPPLDRNPEADIAKLVAQSDVAPEVQDDFDVDPDPGSLNPAGLQDEPGIRERLERRISRTEVKTLQQPRPGKKLLVLDIDYTLFDLGSAAERPEELARPFLHFFLTQGVYQGFVWA